MAKRFHKTCITPTLLGERSFGGTGHKEWVEEKIDAVVDEMLTEIVAEFGLQVEIFSISCTPMMMFGNTFMIVTVIAEYDRSNLT